MSLVQTRNPTINENLDIGIAHAINWQSIDYALENNNLYAFANFGDYDGTGPTPSTYMSNYLYFHTLGFSIPTNAVIDGIRVVVERFAVGSEVNDYYVGLVYPFSGLEITAPGKQKATYWPNLDTTAIYGSETDAWNRSWSPSEINSGDFGFVISAEGNVGSLDSANIDWIEVKVYYHGAEVGDATGGATVNGSITSLATYNPTPVGNLLASGHAGEEMPNIDGTGGISVDGLAAEDHSIFGQGTALLDGSHDELQIFIPSVGGTGLLSGSADVFKQSDIETYWGVQTDGYATIESYINPQGGVLANGVLDITSGYEPQISGGVTLAPLIGIDPMFGEGGASPSGDATIDVLYGNYDGTSGVNAAGMAVSEIELSQKYFWRA